MAHTTGTHRACRVGGVPPLHVPPLSEQAPLIGASQRWDAFAARHGPLIAAQMSTTMAKLFDANGDPDRVAQLRPGATAPQERMAAMARGVRSALTSSWTLEGPIGDLMLAAWAEGRAPGTLVDDAVRTLESVRGGADAALEALGRPAWRPTGERPADAADPD